MENQQPKAFLEQIESRPLLCDGAMSTQLYVRGGFASDRCLDELNLSEPELVKSIHLDYMSAGAEIVETNTFGANRMRLAAHGLEQRVAEINGAAVQIAREARRLTGQRIWIAGAIGPLGRPLSPPGPVTPSQARVVFREQVESLAAAGADLLILETFADLREITEALLGAKDACDLPVVAQMTFTEDGVTPAGDTPSAIVQTLEGLGVDVIGANCSVGSDHMLRVIDEMAKTATTPLAAQPNAGFPTYGEGRLIYHSSPQYMARTARLMVEAGATVVGSCCGTTPEHIGSIRDALRGVALKQAPSRTASPSSRPRGPVPPPPAPEPTRLSQELGRKFVATIEADPPKGFDVSGSLEALSGLKASTEVDAISVADNPRAQSRMSALAMCTLVQTRLGMETVLHLALRHRNLVALNSELLGAHALGVHNIFVVMGDPPSIGDHPQATAVSDITASGMIKLIKDLNAGVDPAGKPVRQATSFFVGCALNPGADDLDKELKVLDRKVAAGADFILTQPVYDPEMLDRVRRRLGGFPVPLLVGILPLRSHRDAEFLHNEVPGIAIPEGVRERLRGAGPSAEEVGVELSRKLLSEVRPDVAYVMPPFGRYDIALAVLEGVA